MRRRLRQIAPVAHNLIDFGAPVDDAVDDELLQLGVLDAERRFDVVFEGIIKIVLFDFDILKLSNFIKFNF